MCIFKLITGIPCPGCGMTRAFTHFFLGNIHEAFYYHPLFWLVPIVFGIVIFRKQKIISKIYHSNYFWGNLFGVVMTVYAYRMWLYFPNQAPLDFESSGWLPRLISTVFN